MTRLKAASVCSGVGAPEVAARGLAIDWVAACDIDDFSAAVFAERLPGAAFHHAGLETILENPGAFAEAELLVAGTPCQAFSYAGLRRGFADDRGNVTLSFVELVHGLRSAGSLRTFLWENVPGVLSPSREYIAGEWETIDAFGCFLGALVGADAPLPLPPEGRWPGAGMVAGPRMRVAWRVLDAQHFGVPQRRRRVFLVGDLGGGADPAEVLFEPRGLPGDFEPGGAPGAEIAGGAEAGARGGIGGSGDRAPDPRGDEGPASRSERAAAEVSELRRDDPDGGRNRRPGGGGVRQMRRRGRAGGACGAGEIARTLTAKAGDRYDADTETFVVSPVAPTLRARCAFDQDGDEKGLIVSAFNLRGREGGAQPEIDADGLASLRSASGGSSRSYIAVNARQDPISAAVSPPLDTDGGTAAVLPLAEIGKRTGRSMRDASIGAGIGEEGAPSYTLQAGAQHGLAGGGHVRRFTPRECEQLQGFPDDWTRIPYAASGQADGMASDAARYRAIGNSMAVPVMRWLLERIEASMRTAAPLEALLTPERLATVPQTPQPVEEARDSGQPAAAQGEPDLPLTPLEQIAREETAA